MIRKSYLVAISVIVILAVMLTGFGIRDSQRRSDLEYKKQLKQYVMEVAEFSAEEKKVISIAIDHINNPKTIKDDRLIRVYRLSERFPNESDLDLQSKNGIKIESDDWRVDIGDSSKHGNFTAIIDGETLEFIMQIPIA